MLQNAGAHVVIVNAASPAISDTDLAFVIAAICRIMKAASRPL
jgi:hypothetical protein